jgi:hypothetical protein
VNERAYTGEFYSGPHRFNVPMQEAASKWLPRHLRATEAAEIASLSPRLVASCFRCALPRKVVYGETNQPNGEQY